MMDFMYWLLWGSALSEKRSYRRLTIQEYDKYVENVMVKFAEDVSKSRMVLDMNKRGNWTPDDLFSPNGTQPAV